MREIKKRTKKKEKKLEEEFLPKMELINKLNKNKRGVE